MRFHFPFRLPLKVIFAAATFVALAPLALAQDAPSSPDAGHTPPVSIKINELAHRALAAGLKANALAGEGLKPWHLKVDYQLAIGGSPKPVSGTMEEWSAGAERWRRNYAGGMSGFIGTEWSLSRIQRYKSKPSRNMLANAELTLRVTRPVIDPMYQAANIKPDFEMNIQRVSTSGVMLNCASVVDPARYADKTNPEWLFPTYCFDADMHLRLVVAGDTTVQFDDIQPFQNRAVARDVKVIDKGRLLAEMKITLLEPWTVDEALLRPDKNSVTEPYTIEPGFPRPESVYEVAASLPIRPDGFPFTGTFVFPAVIQKDGSVKPNPDQMSFDYQALGDAISNAVTKWKYKPYIVDGQPVEVAILIPYDLDTKPFVPSYERARRIHESLAPDDISSAYDPKRDPEKDLAIAESKARESHKRILVEVGGDWCVWCRYLDKFFTDHADLRDLRDANFVLLKVNISPANVNSMFLSRFPRIPGYPWVFILDANGSLVQSENTEGLESGSGGYGVKAMKDFLIAWKP